MLKEKRNFTQESFESFITFIETLSIESDCYPHTDAKPSLRETF